MLKPANNISSICHLTLFFFFLTKQAEVFDVYVVIFINLFFRGFWILRHSSEEISNVAVEPHYCLGLTGFIDYDSFCFQNPKITQIIQIIFAFCFMYFAFVLSS